MFLGRVAGTVWSTVKWPETRGSSCCWCAPIVSAISPPASRGEAGQQASEPTDDLVVCADLLDAGPGDDVIVAFGHAARVAVSDKLPAGTKPTCRSMRRWWRSSIAWRSARRSWLRMKNVSDTSGASSPR